MNKIIAITVLAFYGFFWAPVIAQDSVVDVITLKDGNGVIKGFIAEQFIGNSMSIISSTAVLKVEFKDMSDKPSKKTVRKDSVTEELDLVVLKNGNTILGKIMEQSPNKWVRIKTDSTISRTYKYESIERIGKETIDPANDIFKAYGLLDVIYTKNGDVVKGIIIEQIIGSSIRILLTDKNILVYDISDIASISKEAFDKSRDIFKQSLFLDVLTLKNGTLIKGIIIQQNLKDSIKIETLGNSNFRQEMAEIVKLTKERNTHREEKLPDSIKEPEFIGDCYWEINPDSMGNVEKQNFTRGTKNHNLIILKGGRNSTTRIPQFKDITFIVKVKDNNISPIDQIKIFKVEYNKGLKKRCIDSTLYTFLSSDADREANPSFIKFDYEKVGQSSFKIKFKILEIGEYAIHIDGCEKTFALFGASDQNQKAKKVNM